MRKYLTFAAVALSSGGAIFAAAGAASAATTNDGLRAAPWLASSPLAMHGTPWGGDQGSEGLCGMQRDAVHVGTVDSDLVQKLCAGETTDQMAPPPGQPVLGPPPVGPPPCTEVCVPPVTPPTPP
ncbi:hypothetical protein KGQ20_32065, partial [Catenulispora sp. NF23]|nr:hypothetical protein [Catenulispora pinistramenti]